MRSSGAPKPFMASDKARLNVEVVFALPERQVLLALEVDPGTTVHEAVEQSGIRDHFPELDTAAAQLGIFGKRVKGSAVLRDGDRIEIYRSLIADPKDARRRRAREKR
jgi:putative ubiquitin-RnfH superfamily antitoxin RatB of RatAB toxin-antitoxin module